MEEVVHPTASRKPSGRPLSPLKSGRLRFPIGLLVRSRARHTPGSPGAARAKWGRPDPEHYPRGWIGDPSQGPEEENSRDKLTQLLNRRAIGAVVDASRDRVYGVLEIDIDDFAEFNYQIRASRWRCRAGRVRKTAHRCGWRRRSASPDRRRRIPRSAYTVSTRAQSWEPRDSIS